MIAAKTTSRTRSTTPGPHSSGRPPSIPNPSNVPAASVSVDVIKGTTCPSPSRRLWSAWAECDDCTAAVGGLCGKLCPRCADEPVSEYAAFKQQTKDERLTSDLLTYTVKRSIQFARACRWACSANKLRKRGDKFRNSHVLEDDCACAVSLQVHST